MLVEIWQEVLGLDHFSVHDSLFELGGHSLMAMQILLRLNSSLGLDLVIRQIFDAPTVARLAAVIDEALLADIAAHPPVEAEQILPNAARPRNPSE